MLFTEDEALKRSGVKNTVDTLQQHTITGRRSEALNETKAHVKSDKRLP